MRIAATRVLQARASLGITRADQFPTITGEVSAVNERTPQQKTLPPLETSATSASLALSWQLDFWGRYRRATEATRANLLATEWARREVITELVADVSSAYFQLRALDLQLEISRRTLSSRQDTLRLTQLLANGGSTSLLDVRQAEQLVYTAGSQIYLSFLLPNLLPRKSPVDSTLRERSVPRWRRTQFRYRYLYHSKKEGGNAFVYVPPPEKQSRVRGALRLADVLLPALSSGYRDRAQPIGNPVFRADIIMR